MKSKYPLNYRSKTFQKVILQTRKYSSASIKIPTIILDKLNDKSTVRSYRKLLSKRSGIYCFVNIVNGNRYIGSAKDLYYRMFQHINYPSRSNIALQAAFIKYGLENFKFEVLEEIIISDDNVNSKALTDLETTYISSYNFNSLYNFKSIATSMLGYKHTELAKSKMKKRFEIKENHPMYGKKHTKESLSLISKPNELNPMFGRTHSESSKRLISEKANKYPKGVGLYDLNNNLILTFKNNVELGKYVNITKSTVGKYMKEGKVYKNKYIFKPIE